MPRGNRYYIPGLIWHVTHRCHKKEFLLKFARDRKCWQQWLYEAKKRYALTILNYTVTSNHIHLLVQDTGHYNSLPKAIQLIAGRISQEYNIRKKRNGAFWEERYHATAVQDDTHLIRCMLYIDLNMVRAGVVDHPSKWPFCGYHEIQNPPQRYSLINRRELKRMIGLSDDHSLRKVYNRWVEAAIQKGGLAREAAWTQSIAVGSNFFVEDVKDKLGYKAIGRKVVKTGDVYPLKESNAPYSSDFDGKMSILRLENRLHWNVYHKISEG